MDSVTSVLRLWRTGMIVASDASLRGATGAQQDLWGVPPPVSAVSILVHIVRELRLQPLMFY
jgi:hypothetical protein